MLARWPTKLNVDGDDMTYANLDVKKPSQYASKVAEEGGVGHYNLEAGQ